MTDRFILESFWQREDYGNCTTVATIKAAIIKHGCNKVFRKIEKRGNYLLITLQSNELILLSNSEIKDYNKDNGVGFQPYRSAKEKKDMRELKNCVCLCFAVMVKYLKEYGFDDEYYDWEARETLLHDGINADYSFELLGLKRGPVKEITKRLSKEFKRKKAMLIYHNKHTVAASGGFFDVDGDANLFEEKRPKLRDRKAKWWYEII
jgi:hypothetical protein